MIVNEYYTTRKDGVVLNKVYSDTRHYVIDMSMPDVEYEEIIYPAHIEKTFVESENIIPDHPEV